MRALVAGVAIACTVAGCGSAPDGRFDLDTLRTVEDRGQYGTTYMYKGMIRGTGDLASGSYLVAYELLPASGTVPADWPDGSVVTFLVRDGVGHVHLSGGYFSDSGGGSPTPISLKPRGYVKLDTW